MIEVQTNLSGKQNVEVSKIDEVKIQVSKKHLVKVETIPTSTVNIKKIDKDKAKVEAKENILLIRKGAIYEGEYEVKPKAFKKTTLETQNKTLLNDITVLEIPYFETSNEFGSTVYIGAETEIE